jgi:hypothetical protein
VAVRDWSSMTALLMRIRLMDPQGYRRDACGVSAGVTTVSQNVTAGAQEKPLPVIYLRIPPPNPDRGGR